LYKQSQIMQRGAALLYRSVRGLPCTKLQYLKLLGKELPNTKTEKDFELSVAHV